MKAISVKQPWASLIVNGVKDIENRTWKCPEKYIGQRVLIHASAEKQSVVKVLSNEQKEVVKASELWAQCVFPDLGAIIGSVEIVDCVVNHSSIWAEKTYQFELEDELSGEFVKGKTIYNWVLAHPRLFPEPIPAKGKLGFWEYPNILAEPEEKDGELFCHCQLPVKEMNQVFSFSDHYRCNYCGGRWYK
jgi:hypothetical protein